MTMLTFSSAEVLELLDALREAMEDCQADNSERAFMHLRRAERILGAASEPELLRANG